MCGMWFIEQKTAYEIIDVFYNWLIVMVKKDCNELKFNSCQDFLDEYQKIVDSLVKKREFLRNDIRYKQFNADSIRRLKIIIGATAEEYEAISNSNEKDMVYFNSLLGWYEAIPSETDMFIDSLLNKQFLK